MVDAAPRPRPTFETFLQSDSTKDGLSYSEYQRLLRSKNIALLQEQKERSHELGYKKPNSSLMLSGPVSRKIFQLKTKDPATLKTSQTKQNNLNLDARSKTKLSPGNQLPKVDGLDKSCVQFAQEDESNTQSERLPRIKTRVRMVKSATARDHQLSSPSHVTSCSHERPKTVGGLRDLVVYADQAKGKSQGVQTEIEPPVTRSSTPLPHKRAYTESTAQVVDLEDAEQSERDALVRAYTWRTSSQRAADEIGWNERVPPSVPPAVSTIEQFPDPVSMKLTFRRYHSEPAEWQNFGAEWDFVQSRRGKFINGPQGINYCSRKTQQIPGYYGHIPDNWMTDMPDSNSKPTFLIRSLKPRATNTSRLANIPGYTGCVHWTAVAHAHSNMPLPEPTTSARTHREIQLEEEKSPFARNSILSKMVKTVSPYNPYNKIDYS